jgi:Fe-S cluster biosynthesis and repair protein YggX
LLLQKLAATRTWSKIAHKARHQFQAHQTQLIPDQRYNWLSHDVSKNSLLHDSLSQSQVLLYPEQHAMDQPVHRQQPQFRQQDTCLTDAYTQYGDSESRKRRRSSSNSNSPLTTPDSSGVIVANEEAKGELISCQFHFDECCTEWSLIRD